MARSKQLHFITKEITLLQGNDPNISAAQFDIDVALELSKVLGRNIRQGNSFRLVGYGASLRPFDAGGDVDVGFSTTTGLKYIPTNRYAVKAWNNLFKQWKAQKNLRGAVGSQIRYDDMELAYNSAYIDSRTSSIDGDGLDQTGSAESLVLTGGSSTNLDWSLQDYANSAFRIPQPSLDPFDSSVIKSPKFSQYFPEEQTIYMSSTNSAMVDTSSTPDSLGGGLSLSDITWLPSDNHLNIFLGLFNGYVKIGQPDTLGQNADELKLVITLVFEGWNSIFTAPKKRMTYKGGMKRGSKSSSRYGRRRYSRK